MLDEPIARWRARSPVGRDRSSTARRGWARRALVLVLSLVLLPGWTTGPAEAATRTLELAPTAMTFTDRAWPVGSFADRDHLSLSHTRYATYLAYDLADLGADRRVVSAELVLRVDRSEASERGLLAWYTSPDWSAEALNGLNAPSTTSSVVSGQEDLAPRPGAQVTLPLVTTSGIQPRGRVGLRLGFARGLEEVQLSEAEPPTLRLVVERKSPKEKPGTPPLPYAVAPIGDSPKKVYAHYLPPYPISIDNENPAEDYYSRNYLAPEGEGGKFRSVGGLLRDRPVPRPPIPEDYELVDATTEVDQAAAAGIDGFTVDLLDWTGPLWDRSLLLAKAADRDDQGFVVVPNLDLASDADDAPVGYIADRLAEFFRSPAAERLPDGRYVLSSFKAEEKPPSWWQSVMTDLAQRHGMKVALISVLLDASQANLEAFAPVSYALSTWGVRSSTSVLDAPDRAGFAHRAGVKWMAPIAVQDVRHHTLLYAEAGNTETLRASWSRAMSDKADLVQLITWNDYSESTQFAPSQAHGSSFLDVNGYFLTQFKTGHAPPITGDELVVSHRIQRYGAEPTLQQERMSPTLSGTSVKPRNTVEVLAMLQAPAQITIRVGRTSSTFSASAGLSAIVVPLGTGTVAASASRYGQQVAAVTSPHEVVDRLPHYDLQYYAASSRTG